MNFLSAEFPIRRIHTPRVAAPIFAIVLAGIVLMHFSSATLSVLLAAILIGCGAGAEYCLYPYLITRMFGLRRFGQLYSGVYIAAALSYSVGPVVMGRTYDALGSYRFGFIGFEVALVLTLVLVGSLRRYVYALDGSKL